MVDLSKWIVVLIDDEEDIRDIMSISLKDAGCQVYTASNGNEGLNLCRQVKPQIVMTDIRMPGMDGLQVLKEVKKLNFDIEVIVFSAFGEMDLAIKALQLNASDFITKPVDDEALQQALRRARERYNSKKELKDYTSLLKAEKAQTVQELKKTFYFQKNLVESSMDGIIACDKVGTVLIFNKSMEKMLGYTKRNVINTMTLEQFFGPGQFANFDNDLAGGKFGGKNRLFLYETTLISHSGHKIPVQVSAVILAQAERDGLVCFFRDLREIRNMEREFADQARILHQDKMMSLGRLAASVVHEINNPLSGILNYARLMIRILKRGAVDAGQQAKFEQYLNLVESETDRCSQIVSNLLAFSRKTPLAVQELLVVDLIGKCSMLSRHKLELHDIVLTTHVESNIPPVKGDFNQLQQCLINLIFNAIDAMPTGGGLTLTGYYDASASMVTIVVKDTGVGISPTNLPYIFEPFFTTKDEGYGTGLGLSTVYGILEHHQGQIKVESQEGKGSIFTIQLPPANIDDLRSG
ncbi:MAG: response regulator [Deltaproteobacteria bacterium]|nr:response regulator [Deltaproteobacteria bacterium]